MKGAPVLPAHTPACVEAVFIVPAIVDISGLLLSVLAGTAGSTRPRSCRRRQCMG